MNKPGHVLDRHHVAYKYSLVKAGVQGCDGLSTPRSGLDPLGGLALAM